MGHIEITSMGYDAYLTRHFFHEFIEDNESKIEKAIMRQHVKRIIRIWNIR